MPFRIESKDGLRASVADAADQSSVTDAFKDNRTTSSGDHRAGPADKLHRVNSDGLHGETWKQKNEEESNMQAK